MPQDAATHLDDDFFGEPLFNDPSVRHLRRVGVVDVGSNSVRLVVFDGAARSPAYFYNEKIMCALGQGLAATGHLNPEGRARALSAISRFQYLARTMGIGQLSCVATAAVREASDGPDFIKDVLNQTGIRIKVIDGTEEARLSAQGVLLGWPGAYGLVCDIGGASMELAEIADGKVGKCLTSNLGPLKLMDLAGTKADRKAYIKQTIAALEEQLGPQHNRLFLVGGSWRAIARIDMERLNYPLHVLHEYRMSRQSLIDTCKYIELSDLEQLRQRCGISASRMALVPLASEVLRALVARIKPRDIAISSYGIREGLLYEQMPQKLRDRDPLMEAARYAESKDARLPGFGSQLYHFVRPIVEKWSPEERRLVKAAALMHDVTWRAHPDYRAEVCFDNATRANLGGLKHSERIFLGLSLFHRYTNKREGTRLEQLFSYLKAEKQQKAEIVGKALRFGAMLWMDHDTNAPTLNWHPKKRLLILNIHSEDSPLLGEVALSRFESLAASLNAQTEVRVF